MCAHDLELRIEVKGQIEETSPCSGGMARGHGLKGIVDHLAIASANRAVVHEIGESSSGRRRTLRNHRLADRQEVRTKSADKPLDEHLEDRGCDQTWHHSVRILSSFFL